MIMVSVGPGIENKCNSCGTVVDVDQAVESEEMTGNILCEQCYNAEMTE